MKKILSFIYSLFLLTMIFCILSSSREVAGDKKAIAEENLPGGPPCPHFLVEDGDGDNEPDHVPTTPFGSECRLHRDVIGMVEPLKLESGIKLNCQGHKILPLAPGQPDNPATPAFDPVFSKPQVPFFLNEVHGMTIQNCVIDGGFDFGILAINSKVPEDVKNNPDALEQLRNKIYNNTINAWYVAIHLMASDNFDIELNRITYFAIGGAATHIDDDSDMNAIKNNTITADIKTRGAVSVPGPAGALASPSAPGGSTSNQVNAAQGSAVTVTQNLGPNSTLFNVVIEGNPPNLYQLTLPYIPELNEAFTADNIVEANDISVNIGSFDLPGLSVSGIAAPSSLRTTILNNKIQSPFSGGGIRDGQTTVRLFPGKCTLDSNRHCLTDADCFIDGIDAISNGTCTDPPPTLQNVDWSSSYLLIENNKIEGPFGAGISIAAYNATVRGNRIIGPLNPGGLGGIALRGKTGLETGAVVTRNTVSNVSTALRLDSRFGQTASFFDAKISLNDFTGYTTAVSLSGTCALNPARSCTANTGNEGCIVGGINLGPCVEYSLETELSVDELGNVRGNNWDLTCADAEGGFDPNKVINVNNSVNMPPPNVVDSNPYGEEVGVIVADSGPCDMVSKTCNGNAAIGCATDANCINYTERPEPPPPLTCPEQGF